MKQVHGFDFERLEQGVLSPRAFQLRTKSHLLEIPRDSLLVAGIIGSGSFAQVYQARMNYSTNGGSLVAVKQLLQSSSSAHETILLLQEGALLSGLTHTNVVKLIGVVTISEPVFIVLEHCEFGALSGYLASRDELLPALQLTRFCQDCAAGMVYVSGQGIVHGDLGARNVLVDSTNTCKISDFGMSRRVSDLYASGGMVMAEVPVRWAAPETLASGKFTEQTDVWSYGILLHEIWSKGALPYGDMPEMRVWVEVIDGYRLPRPRRCPDAIHDMMESCWRVHSERPRFEELLHSCSAILGQDHQSPVSQQPDAATRFEVQATTIYPSSRRASYQVSDV